MSKNIIKIQDLHFYRWQELTASSDLSLFKAFFTKFKEASSALAYFKGFPGLADEISAQLSSNLTQPNFILLIEPLKDTLVFSAKAFNIEERFVSKPIEEHLIRFLFISVKAWRGLITPLAILYKVFPEANLAFGKMELFFVSFWIESILVIDELVSLLHSINSSFIFQEPPAVFSSMGHLGSLNLPVSTKNLPLGFYELSKELLIEGIVKTLVEGNIINMLYASIEQDINHRNVSLNNNNKEASVKEFIGNIFQRLSLETLRFLYLNPVYIESDLKNFVIATNERSKRRNELFPDPKVALFMALKGY